MMNLCLIVNIFAIVNIGTKTFGCSLFAVNKTTQIMTSPNFPLNYTNGYICSKLFVNSKEAPIEFRINHLNLESHEFCDYDNLRVFDGRDEYSPLLGKLCGKTTGVLRTSGSALYVTFKTDSTVTSLGFNVSVSKLGYEAFSPCISSDQCETTLICKNGKCDCRDEHYLDSHTGTCYAVKQKVLDCIRQLLNQTYDPEKPTLTIHACLEKEVTDVIRQPAYGNCSTSSQCQETLACLFGKCKCIQENYFDISDGTCKARLGIKAKCLSTSECIENLSCVSGICDCTLKEFYNTSSNLCNTRKNVNSWCSDSNQCQTTLTCTDGQCGCERENYLDSLTGLCKETLPAFSVCNNSSQCQETLVCLDDKCKCLKENYLDITEGNCKSKLNIFHIVGIAIGGLIFVAIIVTILIWRRRRWQSSESNFSQENIHNLSNNMTMQSKDNATFSHGDRFCQTERVEGTCKNVYTTIEPLDGKSEATSEIL